ncbi:hypothetical protein ACQPXM_06620 [Kribbella sp. CA-253562]
MVFASCRSITRSAAGLRRFVAVSTSSAVPDSAGAGVYFGRGSR